MWARIARDLTSFFKRLAARFRRRSNAADDQLRIGSPAEWQRFVETHTQLAEEMSALVAIANKVFDRSSTGNNRDDVLVFNIGMMCFEDFEDIFCLVANGRGFGAQKILRAMFEHIVTATYIHKHPEQAKQFLDFEHMRNFKVAQEVEKVAPGQIDAQRLEQARIDRDRVRESFKRRCTCHKKCEHVVDAFSWTEMGIPDLASAAGDALRDDLLVSYMMPLTETHPTFAAIAGRQTVKANGMSARNWAVNSRFAGDRALLMAYKYSIQILQLQLKHFRALAHLEAEIDARVHAYNAITLDWNARQSRV